MLGMGDSDKPTNILAYRSKRISGKEVLDRESLRKVIGVGHDWCNPVLFKVVVWYPERFSGLAFLNSAYMAPGLFFDVDAYNRESLRTLGYTRYGYWYLFNSFDAGPLLSETLESLFHLLYHTNAAQWDQNFGMIGAARAWLNDNKTQPFTTWLTEEDKARWMRLYSQTDATEAPLSYYRALTRHVFLEDEADLTDKERKLKVPVVGIQAAMDQVSIPEDQPSGTKSWATNGYTEYLLDAGHWVMLEQKEKVTSILVELAGTIAA